MKTKPLIIGVGNPLRHDDGIGPQIIKILRSMQEGSSPYNRQQGNKNSNIVDCKDLTLFDGGTDGLALLDQVAEYEKVIIIDAVQMLAPPGTVKSFTPAEAKINIKSDVLSTHGFGLADMLKLAEKLDIKTKISIIGIQPKDISFGEGLSNEVQTQIPLILDLIKQTNM
ncbi:MAG: hypothetical protein ACD_21C00194G0001 [uncultured bacterium]|nr:MAG: hypothetical protein ACD_21C00194G0001 [uncultured bacterium]